MISHTDINSNHFSCKGDQNFWTYCQRMSKNYSTINPCDCEFHIEINICSPTWRVTVKDNTEQTKHPTALMHSKEAEDTCQNPSALGKLNRHKFSRKAKYIWSLFLKAYIAIFNLIFIYCVYSSQVEAVCLLFKRENTPRTRSGYKQLLLFSNWAFLSME